MHRDGFTIEDIQQKLYEGPLYMSRVSKEQRHPTKPNATDCK